VCLRRREFIKLVMASSCSETMPLGLGRFPEGNAGARITVEKQRGDPDVPDEQVAYDSEKIQAMVELPASKASFEAWDSTMPLKISSAAMDYLGFCRETSKNQISEFLALFDLPFEDSHGYVAFCAAGLSFCALMTYVEVLNKSYNEQSKLARLQEYMPDLEHYFFYPTVSCVDMYYAAAAKHRWVDRREHPDVVPKKGWVVLYDWSGRAANPDHCGIVTSADAAGLRAIEFNTSGKAGGSERNGGTVSEKSRSYQFVRGFIRPALSKR
jgi:hypothetical protein